MSAIRSGALALLVWWLAAVPAGAAERILNFISDVTVERNGDLQVTETIRVEAEGKEIRRGIFRDFPTVYARPDGTRVVVGFRVEAVTRNGAAENYVLEDLANGIRVRIGSADRTVARGQHEYVIRYRTTRQIGFFDGYDELYWNATGTGWAFPIERAEARITLPDKVPFRQTAIYTGPQGASGKDATVVQQQPGYIVFRTTRLLPPRHGLTVAAAWQKGVIEPPTTARTMQYWVEDNPGLVVGLLGLAVVILYYGVAWFAVGRDPPAGTIIPLFAPPGGMSPSAARYVDRMSFDDRGFAAAIVGLGVKGHLRIVEDGTTSTLEKRAGGKPLLPEEQSLMSRLFGTGGSILLSQANHVQLGQAKEGLSEALVKAYLGKLFTNNYAWSGIGFALVLAIGLVALFAMGLAQQHRLLGIQVMIGIFGVPVSMAAGAMIFYGWQRARRSLWLLISGLVLLLLTGAVAAFFMWRTNPGTANLLLAGTFLAMGALAGAGFPLLKAPSRSGRKTMDEIEGFREYLSVAEEDRLNALNPPAKTPELFEKFLPYAVALDCQNAWAAKFAGVLAAAGTAAAASWYVGNRDWSSDPVSFADHLGGSLTSTIASSSTAPGSSGGGSGGSFGGGSSGGGGGGGGGGGW